MVTFLSIYFGIGLIFGIFNMVLIRRHIEYTFSYKLDLFLMSLLVWPIILIGMVVVTIKEKKEQNEQHLHNDSQKN